jgi:hypothetical protein
VRSAFFSLFLGDREQQYLSPATPAQQAKMPFALYSNMHGVSRAQLIHDLAFFFSLHPIYDKTN